MGPATRRLEERFAGCVQAEHAVAVSSGTAALHLALCALGLRQGDEVLTPSFTFVAASNAILHAGAVPRFVDVDAVSRPHVSAETLARALTPRTVGVCVMHYGGYPCAMDDIVEFARSRGLWIVEDAAHAPGAQWNGIPCGNWGDIGCFSFYGNKNLTCAEGGLVVTRSEELADRVRTLRSHGMTCLTWDRYHGHRSSYDVTEAGFNYRIDDLRASLLEAQLESLPRMNLMRQQWADLYRRILGNDPRWIIPFDGYQGVSAHHLFVVVLAEDISRDRVMQFMKARGIQTSIHYPPIHQFAYYRGLELPQPDLSTTEALGRRLITFPLYPDLSEAQVRWVCEAFREALEPDADRACDPMRDSVMRC